MDTTRIGRGEMIAAASAVALLLIMFIFSWFNVGGDLGEQAERFGEDTGANAWQAFSFIDIVLLVTIIVAIGVAVMAANAQAVNLPVAASALVCGLGILSVLLIIFRIISPPDGGAPDEAFGFEIEIGRSIGVWLGLIAAGGIAYGGFAAMQEEGTSFGAQADRLQNRDAGPPPPSDPPPPGSQPPPAV